MSSQIALTDVPRIWEDVPTYLADPKLRAATVAALDRCAERLRSTAEMLAVFTADLESDDESPPRSRH